MRTLYYTLIGYLCGSILFARLSGRFIAHCDVTLDSADGNPGTANAFRNGGFLCGLLTLCCDLLKGFLPVFFYLREPAGPALAIVLAAPVLGHAFSIFFRFRGGKGIATTFGSLLGLFPYLLPVGTLASFFLLFSIALQVNPHSYRTALSYSCTLVVLPLCSVLLYVVLGFAAIFSVVSFRLLTSKEKRKKCEVRLFWKR